MNTFFGRLSERKYNENDLSDFTWALCYENKAFKHLFVSYCFGDETISGIKEFEREFAKSRSRPDFHFVDDNNIEYLIEIKIYDKKNHFSQYSKAFPKARKSFIANYYFPDQNEWDKNKTWREFIIKLEEEIDKNDILNCELVKGYLRYLKNVTYFYEETPMDFSNLNSLLAFDEFSTDILPKIHDNIVTDHKYKSIGSDYYGLNLTNKKKNNFCFWVGLAFSDNSVKLAFEIHHPYSKEKMDNLKNGTYFAVDDEKNWIELKENWFKKLCDSKTTITIQRKILEDFYTEVLDNLIGDLQSTSKEEISSENILMNISNLNSLLTFYNISTDIFEGKFYNAIKVNKRPNSMGNYYYGLKLKNKKKVRKFDCWVGLAFSDTDIELGFEIPSLYSKGKMDNLKNGTYFTVKEEGWIILKKNQFNKLYNSATTITVQRKILEGFYTEVLGIFDIKP